MVLLINGYDVYFCRVRVVFDKCEEAHDSSIEVRDVGVHLFEISSVLYDGLFYSEPVWKSAEDGFT
jgi:hypothetical protein